MNYITLSDLIQLGIFLVAYTSLVITFFHNKRK